jgi:protocatechuate 3,4-dioxygenase beta subunit
MNRKIFIVTSALSAFSLTTLGAIVKNTAGEFKGDCETTNDILGPFYRPNTPIRSNLVYKGLKGTLIELKGKVFAPDCTTIVKNAMIEIWHCNTEGEYDNTSKEYRSRGRLMSDGNGEYSFKTILPGKYLNGELYRPSHIHYRVTEANSKELISQIYFKGDPNIAEDPWASEPKAIRRILPIAPDDIKGNLTIKFDIYLSAK